jgi:hypothetical protein
MLIEGTPDVLFAPKTPGAFGGLGLSTSDLPENWSSYSPAQKIAYFNENLIIPSELLTAGVSQSDIDWMMDNGYDVQKIEIKLADAAKVKADFAAARAAEEAAAAAARAAEEAAAARAAAAARSAAARAAEEAARAAEEAAKPAMVGNVILPTGFSDYSAAQKIKFFNDNLITPKQLLQAGVSQSDIDWMITNGYVISQTEFVYDDFLVNSETSLVKESTMPITIGKVTLPSNWETFTAARKISFFNQNSITETMLLEAGVSMDEITWMKSNGYTGQPAGSIKLTETTTQTNAALHTVRL